MRNLNQKTATAQATNGVAAATIAAPGAEQRMRAQVVVASFSGAPAAPALLTISSDNTGVVAPGAGNHVLLTVPVGVQPLVMTDLDLRGAPGGTLVASLAAGGAAIVGGIFILATFEGA
jgi:hypothetical protein